MLKLRFLLIKITMGKTINIKFIIEVYYHTYNSLLEKKKK